MALKYSKETVDLIIGASDIVETISKFIPVQKKGSNFFAICPFHSDTSPSLSISPQKQIYKCFSCGNSGNVVTFVKEYKKILYLKALEYLAQEANIDVDFSSASKVTMPTISEEDQQIIDLLQTTNSLFRIHVNNPNAMMFLQQRNLNSPEILEHFSIGFAPDEDYSLLLKSNNTYNDLQLNQAGLINDDLHLILKNRISFAIKDAAGHVVGFSGRQLSNDKTNSKYVNTPETKFFIKSKILYNYNNAQEYAFESNKIIIVEGFMDVIALYKAGIQNVVGLMGTALTYEHLALLKNFQVTLFLDNDIAGKNATIKSLLRLIRAGFTTLVVQNHLDKDPDEILNHLGKEPLLDLLENNLKAGEHILYEYFLEESGINFDHFDPLLNSFKKLKNKLLETFVSESSQQIIQERFQADFPNQELIFRQYKKSQHDVVYDPSAFEVIKQKQADKYLKKNIKLQIILTLLANHYLRDVLLNDKENLNRNNDIISRFIFYTKKMHLNNEVLNYPKFFKKILQEHHNLELEYQKLQQDQIPQLLEQIANEINSLDPEIKHNLSSKELVQAMVSFLRENHEEILNITAENVQNNEYFKTLLERLDNVIRHDIQSFLIELKQQNVPVSNVIKIIKQLNEFKK
ncbi:DNA primase [Mycoplasmopsis sturni]|uniref:DNA primase n=1 Tax=Mycoplasmopsis sturni TaxID=39047 RepID=UPI00068C19F7|nr:DNA primase [Mycoplasmopsis sturni]